MNKKANAVIKVLTFLIVAIVTSALVLILVKTEVVSVKAEHEPVQVLNTNFLPVRNVGKLSITEFNFCSFIDEDFNCAEKNSFTFGEEINFRFVIDSTVFDNQVMVVENYRVKDSFGNIVLDANSKDNFYIDIRSNKKSELVTFKDVFTIFNGEPGQYTLDLIVENPLIEKRAVLSEKFEVLG